MKQNSEKKLALVTGCSGFIGFHTCKSLIKEGYYVIGIDDLNDYYDVNLKLARQSQLLALDKIKIYNEKIQQSNVVLNLFKEFKPSLVIHLAAQAGVRYSIENPRTYLESNINGTFEILEAARLHTPKHILMASTSSAYGSNYEMPYKETVKADNQMSFYAATKKATENMAHSYAHLFDIPITMFRFFTVYGPWGRPDMALYKFTKSILNNEPIQIFNNGNMKRDFTYVDDLVHALLLLINKYPDHINDANKYKNDSISPVAPFRVINIGKSMPEKLEDFIVEIENALNKKAIKEYKPMQAGDVHATWADSKLLEYITGYKPNTNIKTGITNFVNWYLKYMDYNNE